MRTARAFILSVVSGLLGFACTGEEGSRDGKSGTETGGSSGVGGTAGALGGSGGTAASSGSASGGGGTGGAGATSGGAAGDGAGTSSGGAGTSGAPSGGAGAVAGDGGAGANGGGAGANGGGAGGNGGSAGGVGGTGGGGGSVVVPSVLVFSRTTGFRHDSIADGITALRNIATNRDWDIVATEDPTIFSDSGLEPFNVIVFLSPTGEILDTAQQGAFERYIRAGGGYAGIHAASDTEFDWAFYGEVVGAYFREHPAIQQAVIRVETNEHPSTATLPAEWRRTDEWYSFRTNPRPNVTVLLTLDESSYSPGTSAMGADHPIAWYHVYEGARCFYTALGHTRESYTEPAFVAHITGGIEWAAGR